MPARIQVTNLRDFTGGLNLRRDTVQLGSNESPDLLNVDVDPRGGFHQRWGTAPFSSTALGNAPVSAWEYANVTGSRQVMVHDGNTVWVSSGGEFTQAFSRGLIVRGATMKDRCYAVNGGSNSVRWDGAAATPLNWAQGGDNWNANLETPTSETTTGAMPVARCVAAHQGHLWVANTLENGKRYGNRLRFSHPNFPESWRSYDFIDVDPGVDGDEITALVPYADRLLVFKKRSIHAIYGADPETFQVFPITTEVGAISQEAVVSTDLGIYFMSWPDGVFLYQGKQPEWQFDRIFPAIQDGKIPQAYASKIVLGWGGRRLWVSVPWEGSTTNKRTFVLDPSLSKAGSWVAYDLGLSAFVEYNPPGSSALLLGGHVGSKRVLKLDQRVPFDNFGSGNVPIETHFRTAWFDLGEQAMKKRWKRPEIMLRGGTTAEVYVKVFRDWDPSFAVRNFKLNTEEDSDDIAVVTPDLETGAPVGEGWGSATWGVSKWGRGGGVGGPVPGGNNTKLTGHAVLERGNPLGQSKAVGFLFIGPKTNHSWGIDSIALKFIPRRIRS